MKSVQENATMIKGKAVDWSGKVGQDAMALAALIFYTVIVYSMRVLDCAITGLQAFSSTLKVQQDKVKKIRKIDE